MDSKICSVCRIEKPISEFHIRDRNKGIYHPACKECHRGYVRDHYQNNKKYYLLKAQARNERIRSEIKDFIFDYLSSRCCADCGESDFVVLEFDHCRGEKKFNIADAVWRAFSLETIKEEISKCDVVCANCHKRRTYQRADSWRHKRAPVAQRTEHLTTDQGYSPGSNPGGGTG